MSAPYRSGVTRREINVWRRIMAPGRGVSIASSESDATGLTVTKSPRGKFRYSTDESEREAFEAAGFAFYTRSTRPSWLPRRVPTHSARKPSPLSRVRDFCTRFFPRGVR